MQSRSTTCRLPKMGSPSGPPPENCRAARIITPLTRWQRFDETRQALMKAELERIRAEKLSPNVYEMVERALADA